MENYEKVIFSSSFEVNGNKIAFVGNPVCAGDDENVCHANRCQATTFKEKVCLN